MEIKRLSEDSKLPIRSSEGAAGYDLFSSIDLIIKARTKGIVEIGISLAIPKNHYGRISSRSSLAVNYDIDVGAGVIDEDYRGPIKVILFNHGYKDFIINKGDRIAQLIIEKISYPEIIEVNELDQTLRGDKGFGSTGK